MMTYERNSGERAMSDAARAVLADCRLALEMLETEEDENRWRVHWAGAVALVRAVGHVLDKVDGERPEIKKASREAFARWKGDCPDHAIFRDFIETERNNILKRYESKVHPLDEVPIGIFLTISDPKTGEMKQVAFDDLLGENLFKPMVEGYGEGDDARDVYSEAIAWWERELDAVDAAARTS